MTGKTNIKKPVLSTTEKAMKILAIAVEKAANKITDTAGSAVVEIHKAANVASDKIASDVSNAKKVIADDAATALKVSNATPNLDHDLLTKVDLGLTALALTLAEVKKELKEDIKDIKDGTSQKIEDNRRNIEAISNKLPGLLSDVEDLKKKFREKNEKQDEKITALEQKTANYTITMVLYSIAVAFMIGLTLYHIISKS